jgi:hypothetical protein
VTGPRAQDDLTADDAKVSPTDNGWKDGDGPQPAQIVAPPTAAPAHPGAPAGKGKP